MTVTVARLTRELIRCRLRDILALDYATLSESGRDFVDEAWGADQFLAERPGKWDYSHLALGGDCALGYWIASTLGTGVHTHRVAVHTGHRRRGVGRLLWQALLGQARVRGASPLTLAVAVTNQAALTFYQNAGFIRLQGQRLERFAKERGAKEFTGDRVIESGDFEKFILLRESEWS